MSRFTVLKALNASTDRWSIVVQVLRKWDVNYKSNPKETFCLSMLLVDAEGTRIQASVLNKGLLEEYKSRILEGHIYMIANFVVSKNESIYKASNHPFKLNLTPQTHVVEKEGVYSDFPNTFWKVADVIALTENDKVDYLIDVIGYVKEMGNLEEYRRDNELKNKLCMVLCDTKDNCLDCILFDECASNTIMCQVQNIPQPMVVVIHLARVVFSEGKAQISNSFNATRVSFNPAMKEVKEMLNCAKDQKNPITLTVSDDVSKRMTQPYVSPSFETNNSTKICDIVNKNAGESFIIHCEVDKLETKHGWMYDGCSKCGTKPRIEGSILVCSGCKKKPDAIEAKMKLHYLVKDDTGAVSVIFWDKFAAQLIGKSASEMKLKLLEEDRGYDFPDELDSIIGKRMVLHLKLNDYNKKYPAASISVISYIVGESLLSKFNMASDVDLTPVDLSEDGTLLCATDNIEAGTSDVGLIPASKDSGESLAGEGVRLDDTVLLKKNVTDGYSRQKNRVALKNATGVGWNKNDKENSEISDLCNDGSYSAVRGRRRGPNKRNVVMEDCEVLKEVPGNVMTTERLHKIIKQEK